MMFFIFDFYIRGLAEYSGYCMICGKHMNRGTNAQQFKGVGIRHISCGKNEDRFEELKQKSFEAIAREDSEAAAEFAQEALGIQPNGDEIFNLAGSVYDKWDFQTAIKLYDRILDKNPNHVRALMNKASSLRYIGKYDKAIRCYNKIIKKQPKNIEALQSKAFVYIYNIRDGIKKAIPIVKKILKISPSNATECAFKFVACGEYERAIKLVMKALDTNQDLIDARMQNTRVL